MSESISKKVARHENALRVFLERVRRDPNLLAAVLVGSLTEETVWQRDSISLWLIESMCSTSTASACTRRTT